MQITLTNEEAQDLSNLLDLAVKAGGIKAAAPALAIASKMMQAHKSAQPAPEKKTSKTATAKS